MLFVARSIYRGLYAMMEALAAEESGIGQREQPTAPVRCARCGAEPWVIRWGNIRVGQDLAGYYYQATLTGAPDLLCRDCWHQSLGVDDPLTGTRRERSDD